MHNDDELRQVLDLLSRTWVLDLMRRLDKGPAGYAQLRDAVNPDVAPSVLTKRLEGLVELGIVRRDETPGPPRRIRYEATPRLARLLRITGELGDAL